MAGSWNEAACPTGTSAAGPMAVPEGTLPGLGPDELLGLAVAVGTGTAVEGRLDVPGFARGPVGQPAQARGQSTYDEA